MATDWNQKIGQINGLRIGVVVWFVLYWATQIFIGNQPVFPFFPYGALWLFYIGLILLLAYQIYRKPEKAKFLWKVLTILLVANIGLLVIEGFVQYERGTLYYWRSLRDVLFSALLWFWLKARHDQACQSQI